MLEPTRITCDLSIDYQHRDGVLRVLTKVLKSAQVLALQALSDVLAHMHQNLGLKPRRVAAWP